MNCTQYTNTHPHLTVLWPLLEPDTLLIESLDCRFEVVDSYADMSESLPGLVIARSIAFEAIIFFCRVISTGFEYSKAGRR